MSEEIKDPPEASDQDVQRQLARLTRRGFLVAAAAAGAGFAGWRWLVSREPSGGIPWPFRRVLEANEGISNAAFSSARLSPTFSAAEVTPRPRVNGHIGLDRNADHTNWKLRIEGSAVAPVVELTMADIRALPRHQMVTEFKCIEGWSQIVRWSGARLSDVMRKFPPPSNDGSSPDIDRAPDRLVKYVAMETPARQYYVGLDMQSALHPQTLLAYEINGVPLSWDHGAPLRLAIPVKYGIKNIKRLALIRYTDDRPADFWAERGYDWYAGH